MCCRNQFAESNNECSYARNVDLSTNKVRKSVSTALFFLHKKVVTNETHCSLLPRYSSSIARPIHGHRKDCFECSFRSSTATLSELVLFHVSRFTLHTVVLMNGQFVLLLFEFRHRVSALMVLSFRLVRVSVYSYLFCTLPMR